jgi:uncharacterized membrane protein YfcA
LGEAKGNITMPLHYTALQYFGLITLGFAVSAYGTLIGAGGGFVLMPLLLILYPQDDPHLLTSISLAVVLINTLSGTAAYSRMKRIDYRAGLTFAISTIPGAIFGALTTASVSRTLFEGFFSVFLIGLAIYMFLRPKSDTPTKYTEKISGWTSGKTRAVAGVDGKIFEYTYNPALGVMFFFFLGFLASFLGIGGGSLMVPILAYVLNFPVLIAAATSQLIVAILTFTGTVSHIWIGSFHHGVHRIAAIGIGMLTGAQLGAYLSARIKGAWLIRSLALALILVGLRMLIAVLW